MVLPFKGLCAVVVSDVALEVGSLDDLLDEVEGSLPSSCAVIAPALVSQQPSRSWPFLGILIVDLGLLVIAILVGTNLWIQTLG